MATVARASFRLFKQHVPPGNMRARSVMTGVRPRGKQVRSSSTGTGKVVAAGAAATAAMVTVVILSASTDSSVFAEGRRESGRAAWGSRLSSQARGDKKEEAEKLPDEGPYFNPDYDFLMVSDARLLVHGPRVAHAVWPLVYNVLLRLLPSQKTR